jgi:hypothetical protein
MYRAAILLMMIVLPLCSIVVEHVLAPATPLMLLVAKWFVFWAVGVRLLSAGAMQLARPSNTAGILGLKTDEALPLVRELGIANFATGVVGIASLAEPAFVLPISIWAAIFYAGAGVGHAVRHERSAKENLAMITDIYAFAVLAVVVVTRTGFPA